MPLLYTIKTKHPGVSRMFCRLVCYGVLTVGEALEEVDVLEVYENRIVLYVSLFAYLVDDFFT